MSRAYKRLNYEWVNNGSRSLIILFQSAGRITPPDLQRILDGTIGEAELEALHGQFTWKKFSLSYPSADYLFIKDYFSHSYGWYVMDSGQYIHSELNMELEHFLAEKAYDRVIAYGSSKGGTASLLYGMLNRYITHVFALVPQIEIARYWRKYLSEHVHLILGSVDPKRKELGLNSLLSSHEVRQHVEGTQFYTYTGVKDDQFRQIMKFHREWTGPAAHNLIVNTSPLRHTPLVSENTDFLYETLRSFVEARPIADPRLVDAGGGTQMLV